MGVAGGGGGIRGGGACDAATRHHILPAAAGLVVRLEVRFHSAHARFALATHAISKIALAT